MSEPVVVCVDDDAGVAKALARWMKRERLHPLTTTEPQQALEWILEHDVAVLVSDYHMPVMNGVELAAHVRRLRPVTVRILLTGNPTVDTAMAGINEGGVFRFVTKPVDETTLLSTVHEAVDQHKLLARTAVEREHALDRALAIADLEAAFPSLTTTARAVDGAYIVRRQPASVLAGAGLDALLALRRDAKAQ